MEVEDLFVGGWGDNVNCHCLSGVITEFYTDLLF
jgi:hypothetical protein